MNVAVASGKGGTGKTTFAVNLAHCLAAAGEKVRLLDCDVEEPNDHLFVKPRFDADLPVNVLKPVLSPEKCTGCGKCSQVCAYNAIAMVKQKPLIFNELCHSCGACSYLCPEGALREEPYSIGRVQTALNQPAGAAGWFPFVHGVLKVGEALAPAVVRAVKQHIDPDAVNIIDASPGTSCPVVEAVRGSDVAVLVTEPTPFGLNDLKLAVGLTLEVGVPTGIVVNRSDGDDRIIADYAESVGVPVIGRIPFRREYAECYSRGDMLAAVFPELVNNLLEIFSRIRELRGQAVPPVPVGEEFRIEDRPAATAAATAAGRTADGRGADGFKEIAVISGKGGTGKTTVVSALAQLCTDKVLADNDVDAADLHLLLSPRTYEAHEFTGGKRYVIDPARCSGCGTCAELCHFSAIFPDGASGVYRIDELACEGCGLCALACPEQAIAASSRVTGKWFVSATSHGPMVHARLGIAEENSGKLVTQVRRRAAEMASEQGARTILSDGPPGTGCPVIASVSGVDMVLIVTEPTVSGVHDMQRVLSLSAHFGVPCLVVINKADLNEFQAGEIRRLAEQAGSRVIGEIPFDRNVNDALMQGKTVIEYGKGPAREALLALWQALQPEGFAGKP